MYDVMSFLTPEQQSLYTVLANACAASMMICGVDREHAQKWAWMYLDSIKNDTDKWQSTESMTHTLLEILDHHQRYVKERCDKCTHKGTCWDCDRMKFEGLARMMITGKWLPREGGCDND